MIDYGLLSDIFLFFLGFMMGLYTYKTYLNSRLKKTEKLIHKLGFIVRKNNGILK